MNFDTETYKKATTAVRQIMLAMQSALGGSILEFSYENDSELNHILVIKMSWTPSMGAELPGFDPADLPAALQEIAMRKATIETGLGGTIAYFGYERDPQHGHVMITKMRWQQSE